MHPKAEAPIATAHQRSSATIVSWPSQSAPNAAAVRAGPEPGRSARSSRDGSRLRLVTTPASICAWRPTKTASPSPKELGAVVEGFGLTVAGEAGQLRSATTELLAPSHRLAPALAGMSEWASRPPLSSER